MGHHFYRSVSLPAYAIKTELLNVGRSVGWAEGGKQVGRIRELCLDPDARNVYGLMFRVGIESYGVA